MNFHLSAIVLSLKIPANNGYAKFEQPGFINHSILIYISFLNLTHLGGPKPAGPIMPAVS